MMVCPWKTMLVRKLSMEKLEARLALSASPNDPNYSLEDEWHDEHLSVELSALQSEWDNFTGSASNNVNVFGEISNTLRKFTNMQVRAETVAVTIEFDDSTYVNSSLLDLGFVEIIQVDTLIEGWLPFDSIDDISQIPGFVRASPLYSADTNGGATTTGGDLSLLTNFIRTNFGLDGSGVIIGVISDSFGNFEEEVAADITSGDTRRWF